MKKYCEICNGKGVMLGQGGMSKACDMCRGSRYSVAVDTIVPMSQLRRLSLQAVVDASDDLATVNNKEIEQTKKPRGRPKKVD